MKDKPSDQTRRIEAIELAHRGRADSADPSMARLHAVLDQRPHWTQLCEQSKLADQRLQTALRDVPVPQGLAERILDRLAAQPPADVPTTTHKTFRQPDTVKKTNRRRWIGVSATLLAVSLLVAVVLCVWNSGRLSSAQLFDEAIAQFVPEQTAPGELLTQAIPSHPFSRDILCPRDTRWRTIDDFAGHRAVAYEMTTPTGRRATLFVVSCSHPITELGGLPPYHPQPVTGGITVGTWQSDGFAYALVVEGNARTYRQFLNTTRSFA